jgi:hypothetical protein
MDSAAEVAKGRRASFHAVHALEITGWVRHKDWTMKRRSFFTSIAKAAAGFWALHFAPATQARPRWVYAPMDENHCHLCGDHSVALLEVPVCYTHTEVCFERARRTVRWEYDTSLEPGQMAFDPYERLWHIGTAVVVQVVPNSCGDLYTVAHPAAGHKPLDEQFERVVIRRREWESVEWDDLRQGDIFRRMSEPETYWRILSTVNSPGPGYYFFVEQAVGMGAQMPEKRRLTSPIQIIVMKLEKRTWVYLQRPRQYEIAFHGCGHTDPDWSEYQGHLWCPQCNVDFIPEFNGVFRWAGSDKLRDGPGTVL